MRVGTGAENSGDHELGLWKLVSKHRHEGNGSSLGNRAVRLLKKVSEAFCMESFNQSAVFGAFQPAAASLSSRLIFAP